MALTSNDDIKSRVTYSVLLQKLPPDDTANFIRAELDKVALAHSTFTDDALSLTVRSSEGGLRRARNLCLSALLEAVRDRTKTVDLKQVNRVLLQPHWAGARRSTCRSSLPLTHDRRCRSAAEPYDGVGRSWPPPHPRRTTTVSVAVCDVSPSFSEKSYDVSFAIAYDVTSAGNK